MAFCEPERFLTTSIYNWRWWCLISADDIYEWKKTGGKSKQPYLIGLHDDQPFAFARLWKHWDEGTDGTIESCTITTTTTANELLAGGHDRMPVILPPDRYDVWRDDGIDDADTQKSLLVPYPADEMRMVPVSTLVKTVPETTYRSASKRLKWTSPSDIPRHRKSRDRDSIPASDRVRSSIESTSQWITSSSRCSLP